MNSLATAPLVRKKLAPTANDLAHAAMTTRGHVELRLGRRMVVCTGCKAKKPPRGGWQIPCPAKRYVGEP